MTPWFRSIDYGVKIEGNNRGILAINHCPTLLALKKEGEAGENNICNVVDNSFDVPSQTDIPCIGFVLDG